VLSPDFEFFVGSRGMSGARLQSEETSFYRFRLAEPIGRIHPLAQRVHANCKRGSSLAS